MAETKRSRKTAQTSTKKPGRPKKPPEPQYDEGAEVIRAEVLIVSSFVVAVLLFLSNFNLCGIIGRILKNAQLGLFGSIGYLVPIFLFIGTCFALSNRGNVRAALKLGAAIGTALILCGLCQLIFGSKELAGAGFLEYYQASAATGAGGGLTGGILAGGLSSVVGTVGAYVVLIAALVICIVCITEKSVVKAVKSGGDKAYHYAREDMDRRREIRAERQEERRRMRDEQKVRGVDLNATKIQDSSSLPLKTDAPVESMFGPAPKMSAFQNEDIPEKETRGKAVHPADIFTGSIAHLEDPEPYIEETKETFEEKTFEEEKVRAFVAPKNTRTLREMDMVEAAKAPVYPESVPEEMIPPEEIVFPEEASYPEEPPFEEDPIPGTVVLDEIWDKGDQRELSMAFQEESYDSWEEEELIPDTIESSVSDTIYVPEGEKRVVTASGKIIETETELLEKKLESRKQEIKTEEESLSSVMMAVKEAEEKELQKEYKFPSVDLLKKESRSNSFSEQEYKNTAIKLQQTLRDFGVGVTVTNISCGPSVTRYELHPEQGVKVSKIVSLADDIKLSLAAADIRIEAPIPGKSAVGIEVPNKENNIVYLRELLESEEFRRHSSRLAFAVGKDIGGQTVVTDIAKMPHLLIAGATGSGKSVCINTLIMSILYKANPDDVKLIMVDPKVVELSVYNGIPHLLIPVVTDPKKASGALNWAVAEMTDRYKKFAEYGVRDLKGYNERVENIQDIEDENKPKKMPQIVIIVDELADLMMVAPGEVEDSICRLAQLARAAGIHLVIATQRPSVNVITGLIKANVPSRIAFAVSSGVDSRTIIDMNGAEKLLGKGDMLFYPSGIPKPQRVQGAFVSDQEVAQVVEFLTRQEVGNSYSPDVEQQITRGSQDMAKGGGNRDEYFAHAAKFIIEKDKASIGMLQRVFKIGFNRAARIMDQLAEAGVVGEEEGTKPRKVLMSMEQFEELMEMGG